MKNQLMAAFRNQNPTFARNQQKTCDSKTHVFFKNDFSNFLAQ